MKGERMRTSERILQEVKKAVIGKDELLEKILMAILANGHILMEDMPGVGKTTIARAFADAMQLDCRRMQFTVDVLPADVTGFSVIDPQTGKTQIRKGAVFTNLFLADEINRTSSRTQAALLEVMEEGSVSVDGITMTLEQPFLVIATQNPQRIYRGASPRAGVALFDMSKACALLQGRDYVVPEDIQNVFVDTIAHRILMQPSHSIDAAAAKDALTQLLHHIQPPHTRRKGL